MFKDELMVSGDEIIFTGTKLEFYIPESYGDKINGGKFLEIMGDTLQVFGLFSIRTFDSKGNPGKLETMTLPIYITILNTNLERREIQLLPDGKPEIYNVLTFNRNSPIMLKHIIPDSINTEIFLDLVLKGKLPNTIPYDKVLSIWHNNLQLNNVDLNVPSVILEIILAKVYRYKNNKDKEFAKVIGKNPKISQYEYSTSNVREICAKTSTFAAITFEDMDAMLTTSLNLKNKEQTESPIEKIIKM